MKKDAILARMGSIDRDLYDFHTHTSWTDGSNTVQEMYRKAIELGLKEILFSEHVRKASEVWYQDFVCEVRNLPVSPCVPWVGAEVKIINDEGDLDCTQVILDKADFIIGSVHRFPGETDRDVQSVPYNVAPLNREMVLMEALIKNPSVDILGHPFGMSIRRFRSCPPVDMIEHIVLKCKQYDTAFEINLKYHEDPFLLLGICKRHNALFTIGSDAHSVDELERTPDIIMRGEVS